MTIENKIDQLLNRAAMTKLALENGTDLQANLLPGDVAYLANVLSTYVLKNLKNCPEYAQKDLAVIVSSRVNTKIQQECNCMPQDLSFPEPYTGSWNRLWTWATSWINH